jgi:hypothetical protein
MEYSFFYDESEHSRRLTKDTLAADNFAENFVASIIGYSESICSDFRNDYSTFEEKYKKTFTIIGELKSTVIKPKKYVSGLCSFRKEDLYFISDLLDIIINHDLFLYICVFNKVEYIIIQLLSTYKNSLLVNADSLKYSISKLVSLYHPRNVYESIYRNDDSFISELKKFLNEIKNENQKEQKRELETSAIDQALILLEDSSADFSIDWNYRIAFLGFKNYLNETNINDYRLIIDKEGEGKTLKSAQSEGLKNCQEDNSVNNEGLRITDFVVGIVSSFLKAIQNSFEFGATKETEKLLFLKKNWFMIKQEHLDIYRKLKSVIIDQHKTWYKTYCGSYSDNFLYLICILNYFASFDDIEKYNKSTPEQHQINLNSLTVQALNDRFELKKNKLPIEATKIDEEGTYYNQKGAKCYINYRKHKMLSINNQSKKYTVLSVGFFGKMERACITILDNNIPTCYLLPDELMEWAFSVVALANYGEKLFPSIVEFGIMQGRFYAEIE